jgi:hypothetical protein
LWLPSRGKSAISTCAPRCKCGGRGSAGGLGATRSVLTALPLLLPPACYRPQREDWRQQLQGGDPTGVRRTAACAAVGHRVMRQPVVCRVALTRLLCTQDYTTKEQIGSAYLNYNTVEEGEQQCGARARERRSKQLEVCACVLSWMLQPTRRWQDSSISASQHAHSAACHRCLLNLVRPAWLCHVAALPCSAPRAGQVPPQNHLQWPDVQVSVSSHGHTDTDAARHWGSRSFGTPCIAARQQSGSSLHVHAPLHSKPARLCVYVRATRARRLMYAPQKSQADKDRVFGPYSYKFQVIVKVGAWAAGLLACAGVWGARVACGGRGWRVGGQGRPPYAPVRLAGWVMRRVLGVLCTAAPVGAQTCVCS